MDTKTNIISETATLSVKENKKAYQTPKLETYGQLHSFTQGTGGQASDGALGMTMM